MGSFFEPDVKQQNTTEAIPEWAKALMQEDASLRRGVINREYTPYEGDRSATFNPLQNQAFSTANMFGNLAPGAFGNAYNALTDTTGAGFAGQAANLLGSLAGGGGPDAASASAMLARRGDIRDVNGGSFLGMDRDAYTNQYVQDVSNDVMSDVQRLTDQQRNQLGASASKAGAFGGSRHGVESAILSSEAQRNFGQLSNRLNQQAFDAASGLMGQDLMRGLQADMANQGADQSVALTNAQLGTQTNQFNAGQANNMAQFNQGNALAAAQGLGSLGLGLGNLSLAQGTALQGFGQAGMGAQQAAGDAIMNTDLYNKNLNYQDFLEARDWGLNNFLQSGGLTPTAPVGSTTSEDVFGPSPFDTAVGVGTTIAGIAGKSDPRLKTRVRLLGKVNGHNWYSWVWNRAANALGLVGTAQGVMADEVPEHMRVMEDDGYWAVNYSEVFA